MCSQAKPLSSCCWQGVRSLCTSARLHALPLSELTARLRACGSRRYAKDKDYLQLQQEFGYSESAISRAVTHLERYIHDRAAPYLATFHPLVSKDALTYYNRCVRMCHSS